MASEDISYSLGMHACLGENIIKKNKEEIIRTVTTLGEEGGRGD